MKISVAVIQDAPVLFDRQATIRKVEELMAQASVSQPDLMIFPEAFIPGYPRGLSFGTTIGSRSEEGRDLWFSYAQNSISLHGEEVRQLGRLAKKHKTYLVIGVVEQGETGTLYCTVLYFNKSGELLGKHRKLKPTGTERVIWGEGDGSDLETYQTPFGKIGGLICWENYMPLARTHLYQLGIDIYIAPTADHRDIWQATMKHIACEGRCFVIGCNQFVLKSDYPADLQPEVTHLPETLCRGGSIIIDPFGNEVVAPLWDQSGILHADVDLDLVTKGKMDFDVVGHYARPDVFELIKKADPEQL